MKILKTLVLALFAISTFSLQAKDNEVTLIVTSEGVNKDDAITNALRSAIEQTYGVFVSADTHILNDELVKDEIATISSGNIKSYKELGSTVMSSGQTSVTLEATVSVGKLISYVKSKGAECEFDGASFAQNITLDELYMQNERKVLDDLAALIKKSMPNLYDAKVTVQPAAKNPNSPLYEFIADVELEGNENLTALWTQIKIHWNRSLCVLRIILFQKK